MKLKKSLSRLLFYLLAISIFLTVTYWGSAATSVIAQRIPLERMNTVIIDAGHGGEDGGAISCTGKLESSINLEIAQRLNDLLHLLGIHTVMVRTSDVSVYTQGETIAEKKASDLRNRVKLVNETENSLLISIHQNTFTDSRYYGAQVFYNTKGESEVLAEQLQTTICKTINPGSNRQIKRTTNIYLLEHINRPGILVECGFVSNIEEESKLCSALYQKQLCCVIATSVCNFLDM